MPPISTPDAILRIKKLIANKKGDPGRLQYIAERLQSGKTLFNSDRIYLNKKISAGVIPIDLKQPTEEDNRIKDVKRLLALNFGDPGRLRYILQTLQKNKELYHSDEVYLNNKIEQFNQYTEGKRIRKRIRKTPETIPEKIPEPVQEIPEEKPSVQPAQDIPEKLQEIEDAVLSQEPQTSSDLFDLIDDTPEVNVEIQQEREKIANLKHDHEQIKIKHDELSQLIAYRQEYELKVHHEKEILDKEIKFEQQKVKEKDDLVAQLLQNQSKLLQSKTEREVLLEQINIDKTKSEKDLAQMQKQLEELKEEYETLQKEIKRKKEDLENKIKDQKEKNEKLKDDFQRQKEKNEKLKDDFE